ncbi:hypothetical protein BE20_46140 [Sorangium cellulosum]|uniref:Beta-propeller repeat protein n=1 Tax=Sorangium cellulosum TaxID=56 RepID=A0A150SSU1_SORCE|nr:hypothetical protein BE18_43275 [Sorangium cellulosum]KYF95267.1 hypothetical protein BE20_46140 [Sorangium cellulosum]
MNRRGSTLRHLALVCALATFGCGARSSLDDWAPAPANGPEAGEGGAGGSGVGAGAGGSAPVCQAGCLEVAFARPFDYAEVTGLAVDARGNILITGAFEGTVDFGGGPLVSTGYKDAFVLKLDPLGRHLWSRRFGELSAVPELQAGLAIATDAAGNILVGGHFGATTDFGGGPLAAQGKSGFIVLLDASGQHVWSTHVGAGSAAVRGVGFHPAGGIVVTGDYVGTMDLGGEAFIDRRDEPSVFVARLDAAGGHVWSKSFGRSGAVQSSTLALDAAGNIALGGSFDVVVDFGGGPLRAAGPSGAAGASDIFVASLGPDGEHRWSQRLGSVAGEHPGGTVVDGAGNVVSLGSIGQTFQFGGDTLTSDGDAVFVAKLSATGAPTFGRSFSRAHALAADAAGNTWLAGAFLYDADFGCGPLTAKLQGLFVAGLDPRGEGFCSVSFEPSEYGGLSRIAVDPTGALVAVGNLKGTIDFGAGPISSPEVRESMLVVKLLP